MGRVVREEELETAIDLHRLQSLLPKRLLKGVAFTKRAGMKGKTGAQFHFSECGPQAFLSGSPFFGALVV